jgi:hypothetical protein
VYAYIDNEDGCCGGLCMDSFIVRLWESIFSALRWVSFFQLVRYFFPRLITYGFVDLWVIAHLILSFLATWIVKHFPSVSIFVLIYGFLRVLEIIVYQVNVLLFDEYRALKRGQRYSLRSYRRMLILLFHNFLEIIFWFAASYSALSDEFAINDNHSVFYMIYASFSVMTGAGNSDVHPISNIGLFVIWFQSIAGLFMTTISLARIISFLPKPKTFDDNEQ